MPKEEPAEILSVDGRDVRITNPDKPYFSRDVKLSKLELVRYYLSVAPGALAGIRDRPIVLKRFVNGAEGGAVLSEARAGETSRVAAYRHAVVPLGTHRRRGRRRRRRGARLGRQPRLHRAASARRPRRAISITPTSCASISIPDLASRGTTCAAWRWKRRRCSRSWGFGGGRRRAARAACTSTCASSRDGRSPKCVARRSRSRARSSGARRRSRRPSGGRRNGTASFSTTTRTRRTARRARRTPCGRCLTRACRRRCIGRRFPIASRPTSPC